MPDAPGAAVADASPGWLPPPLDQGTMAKNYYLVLGVTAKASPAEIKAAFRRRALELHPDQSGLESEPFLELQEAYEVLTDPQRRRRYDQQAGLTVPRRRPWGPPPEPLAPRRPAAEPLRPLAPSQGWPELPLAGSFAAFRPSFDELFERLWSNFASQDRPKAEHLERLAVEVVLSPDEARWGRRLRVNVPVYATCPTCGGRGAIGPYECARCAGQGAIATDYPLDLSVPPGTRDGDAMHLSLAPYGIESFYLTVLLRVGDADGT